MAIKYRETPCQGTACGWPYAGFHICLNQSIDLMTRIEDGRAYRRAVIRVSEKTTKPKKAKKATRVKEPRAGDPKRVERNSNIIRLYQQERKTMREIAVELDLPQSTIMNVLHNAADRGVVNIRRAVRRSVGV